jgi:hypothetical protein
MSSRAAPSAGPSAFKLVIVPKHHAKALDPVLGAARDDKDEHYFSSQLPCPIFTQSIPNFHINLRVLLTRNLWYNSAVLERFFYTLFQ